MSTSMTTQYHMPYIPKHLGLEPEIIQTVLNNPNEQYRVNHTSCPDGQDTRRRLYMKIDTDKRPRLMWYCHNCGLGGEIYLHSNKSIQNLMQNKPNFDGVTRLMDDTIPNCPVETIFKSDYWMDLTQEGLKSVNKYTLKYLMEKLKLNKTPSKIKALSGHIRVPEYSDSPYILVPAYKKLFQTSRQIIDTQTGKKYLERGPKSGFVTRPFTNPENKGSATSLLNPLLIITEDVFSACVTAWAVGNASRGFALLGTTLTRHMKSTISQILRSEGISKVIIWLDSDNAGWRAALKCAVQIKLLNSKMPVYIINRESGTEDPKGLTPNEIRRAIAEEINKNEQ